MSARKDVVAAYFDGFRRGDHAAVLALLTEDVVWDLLGYRRLAGKSEFDGEIENPAFRGPPTLLVDRLVEEDGTVVAMGTGEGTTAEGEQHRFAYCTVFTFRDELIGRVDSYTVPLG